MTLILAGTPAFASAIFAPIIESNIFKILALICQPDKPFGRKGELKAPHTKESFAHLGIEILQPNKIDEAFTAHIQALKPDMILVVAYGKILPRAFLDIAPCINIHASILPLWRGASPIQQMILTQPLYFGVSAIKMNEELDKGAILGLHYVPNTRQNITQLSAQLSYAGSKLALYVLTHLQEIEPLEQINADTSYCTKIKKSDGYVDLSCATNVYYKYLAYCEWPHIFIKSTKGYILKLFDVTLIESTHSHKMGEILNIDTQGIVIGCKQGSVCIGALQQEGKERLTAAIYLRGKRLNVGDILC
ncbi:methionyl-tRNA formyltransferase [Helicobacter sp. MIT 21-1697]|uniref:methionyl-tRNA formyltransferase n=1 Tax=Helicobacter sp. MIT 21-1697 TaxID=2993733 RepID=UPI00224AD41A|nr:methionyl-tRNA formyltransferase [Helicobacter sp. MIT 21-1697]MCX2716430.1 methionyl-tRNA formyltransferase [Helicobacter sp. MIT 21-1697]